jgi:NADPH:quinone reductase-like Zn-dependent oxidoreductase
MQQDWVPKAILAALAATSVYYIWSRTKRREKAARMTGKFAIVTGGTSGVGRVAAERLVKKGLKGNAAHRFLRKKKATLA